MGDDELTALRKRAYGRNPDIHLDPASLARLQELERPRRSPEPEPFVPEEPDLADELEPELEEPAPRRTPRILLWLAGVRRSTWLIVAGILLFVATLLTVLTLVERVQPDPLQTGATQVARLGTDDFEVLPPFFVGATDPNGDEIEVQSYEQFYGLRPVLSGFPYFSSGGRDSKCLILYPEANVVPNSDSFNGPIFNGCDAGRFPAMLQFTTDEDGLPQELVDAFPEGTALQVVYDREHDEVVVFTDR